jgi:hypothetical protein
MQTPQAAVHYGWMNIPKLPSVSFAVPLAKLFVKHGDVHDAENDDGFTLPANLGTKAKYGPGRGLSPPRSPAKVAMSRGPVLRSSLCFSLHQGIRGHQIVPCGCEENTCSSEKAFHKLVKPSACSFDKGCLRIALYIWAKLVFCIAATATSASTNSSACASRVADRTCFPTDTAWMLHAMQQTRSNKA